MAISRWLRVRSALITFMVASALPISLPGWATPSDGRQAATAAPIAFAAAPAMAAGQPLITWPFDPTDSQWAIINGYQGAVDHSLGGSPNNYAIFAFDFAKCNATAVKLDQGLCDLSIGWAKTTGAAVYSPVNGTFAYSDDKCFGFALDVDGSPGTRLALYHIDPLPSLAKKWSDLEKKKDKPTVTFKQGDQIGTVSDGTCNGSGNHIHMVLYSQPRLPGDSAINRVGIPFSGQWSISSRACDYPNDRNYPNPQRPASENEYLGRLLPCFPSLAFDIQPSGAQAGSPFTTQPKVTAKDKNGNLVTDFKGIVTLAIKSGTGTSGAVLSGTTTVPAVNGVATFTNLSIDKAGTGYVLTASTTGATSADSNPITITSKDPTGVFISTDDLLTARGCHSATLLINGKVLVTGGGCGSGQLSQAEVYDPANGTWTSAGTMGSSRDYHTATRLPNGKVLITGGTASVSETNATAELYDPASGTFAYTGTMQRPRALHTATMLSNGKVLIAGGAGDYSGPVAWASAYAELYDPATGAWSPTGTMRQARSRHTATLLADGRVLVAGGINVLGNADATAEIYDPISETWSSTGNMVGPRQFHTASPLPNGKVLVFGCTDGLTAEIYEPSTRTWSTVGNPNSRCGASATILASGRLLLAGGDVGAGRTSLAELYDPVSNSFMSAGSMEIARSYQGATLLQSGKVLVSGGFGINNERLSSAELYLP